MRTLELNPSEQARLQETVSGAVLGTLMPEDLLRGRANTRRHALSPESVRVSFDNAASPRATLFEITAEDRPGLLFDLTRSISGAGCNIEIVLVDTEGRKAMDVFYITQSGAPLSGPAASVLSEALRTAAA